jgi:hypothetical protein
MSDAPQLSFEIFRHYMGMPIPVRRAAMARFARCAPAHADAPDVEDTTSLPVASRRSPAPLSPAAPQEGKVQVRRPLSTG